jgi:alpha-mannosidase
MSDSRLGLAVINDGIREYEAVDDEQRTLCITLLRGFTATQSPVIDQWEVYPWMKLSQSLGLNEWRYAIMPHAGNWQQAELFREAEKMNLPLKTAQAGKGGGTLAKEHGFLEIQPAQLVLTAMKKCEHRDSLIVRLFNPTSEDLDGKISINLPVAEAWLTNMIEERREQLVLSGHNIDFQVGHKKILTLEFVIDRQ